MIQLKEISVEDFACIAAWSNSGSEADLYQWAGPGYSYPLSVDQFEKRIRSGEINGQFANTFVYGIYRVPQKNLVGTAELAVVDRQNGTGTFGKFFIRDSERGQGFGKEAVNAIAREAFDYHGVSKLFLKVFHLNTTAIETYKKIGFQLIKKEEHVYDGPDGPWDRLYMMLDREHWLGGEE